MDEYKESLKVKMQKMLEDLNKLENLSIYLEEHMNEVNVEDFKSMINNTRST
jgi:hypothetical protein